jgi:hypothetical protein
MTSSGRYAVECCTFCRILLQETGSTRRHSGSASLHTTIETNPLSSTMWGIIKHDVGYYQAQCEVLSSTMWSIIKHDVAKFTGVRKQVSSNKESGLSPDDVLQNALELYKVKHPKQHSFVFLQCWLNLKEVPRWMETSGESRQRAAAKKPHNNVTRRATALVSDTRDHGKGNGSHDDEEVGTLASNPSSRTAATLGKRGRPTGQKATKEDQRVAKQREGAIRAHARATADMAATNFKKA